MVDPMRFLRGIVCGVTALAISACAAGDDQATPQASHPTPVTAVLPDRAPAPAPAAAGPTRPPVVAATPSRPLPAIAADFARTGEPLIMVAGYRDDSGIPLVPIYAQRNGGWRRIGAGEWPAGAGSIIRAVDGGDMDGDGWPELAALGQIGEGEGALTVLVVFRMRDRDLERIAETRWDGPGDELAIGGGGGNGGQEIAVVRRRDRRELRRYALAGGHLVPRAAPGPSSARDRDRVRMALPDAGRTIRVEVRAASGAPSVLATIEEWNAELARLRPP